MKVLFASTAIAVALGIGAAARADDAVSPELAKLASAWDAAFNSKDAGKVAAMYAEDAQVITGDGTVKSGRGEIEALFQSFMESGFGSHAIDAAVAEIKGDMGYLSGTWSGVGGDGKTYGGHLANVYERGADGQWRAVLHIWN